MISTSLLLTVEIVIFGLNFCIKEIKIFMTDKKEFSYKSIFDETVDAIIITDGTSERIIEVNKAACELLGCKKEELIDSHLFNFLEEGIISEIPKTPNEITMYGSVLANKRVKTKSGQLIPVDMIINTFGNGSVNYVMTSLRDVSERIRYENKIVSINEELSKTNASKDKLFSIIAHDLKNPISALIGLSEIMTNESEEISQEEISEFSGMIKNLSKNTYELLENLLNWARVQTQNIQLEKSRFDLNKLVDKVIDVLKPAADLKKINIVNSIDPGYAITADENMINTIIRNLISNSIKFSPENTSITLTANINDGMWNISVKDEGVGMDESYIADLFKIDIHTSRYGTNKEKGTGLGLVLCYEFAKLHNGDIKVISEINKGSEFIVQLPKQ